MEVIRSVLPDIDRNSARQHLTALCPMFAAAIPKSRLCAPRAITVGLFPLSRQLKDNQRRLTTDTRHPPPPPRAPGSPKVPSHRPSHGRSTRTTTLALSSPKYSHSFIHQPPRSPKNRRFYQTLTITLLLPLFHSSILSSHASAHFSLFSNPCASTLALAFDKSHDQTSPLSRAFQTRTHCSR